MSESNKPKPAIIRHKEYGSIYRIVRTKVVRRDLVWVLRGINADGTECRDLTVLSVDAWATGNWVTVNA